MYLIAEVTFDVGRGDETYEIGSDVDCDYRGRYEVGEPDVSAPDSPLKWSRLVNPEVVLPWGWSEVASDALRAAYEAALEDLSDAAADYAYDSWKDQQLEDS